MQAAGNCSAAVAGDAHPGAGTTIDPAMAFAWATVSAIADERSRP
ncbi:hypothetical protein [Streptomyces sp. TLI_105]|nr:hypothetical protein [Streptomyces sp. TLI_105]